MGSKIINLRPPEQINMISYIHGIRPPQQDHYQSRERYAILETGYPATEKLDLRSEVGIGIGGRDNVYNLQWYT